MLKRVLFAIAIGLMVGTGSALSQQNGGRVPPRPAENLTPEEITIEQKVSPASPLTQNWVFVVDTSSSLWSIFGRIRGSFFELTQYPSDEMNFAAITFNNRGAERFRDWVQSSADEFAATDAWIARNRGALSYGAKALEMALQQNRQDLTIVLITDGGFTEACYNRGFNSIRQVINAGQTWRQNRQLGNALICCLGIENPNYTAGGKPSDAACQEFLQEVGTTHGGGYFLVRGAAAHAQGPGRPGR